MKVLVTGSAGFIGYHLTERLLAEGHRVVGLDAMTDYYDVALKEAREDRLSKHDRFTAVHARVEDSGLLKGLMMAERPDMVVHLAAQAGVRHSIDAPQSYVDANLIGTFNLLEAARACPVQHLLIASTSSVYGANDEMPYRETAKADTQMSFYAATKKATEVMGHSYAHLFDIPMTFFRFFTVYGPWSRPDMAPIKFARAMVEGRVIDVYNRGDMKRDFTYIDDLVDGITGLMRAVPERGGSVGPHDSLSPVAPHRIVNIGNAAPVPLMEFIGALEKALGTEAKKNLMEMQPGDVPATWADTTLLHDLTGYAPKTTVSDGVSRFVAWYRAYYGA